MTHKWHFFRAGGVDQVSIKSGADLLALPELDQKLWVALAMPTRDVDVDPATLDLLDPDQDGRIRAADIIATTRWIGTTWKNADDLLKGGDSVPLASIKDPAILAAARRILADLGAKDASAISVGQVGDVVKAFADTVLNGDAIIIAASAGADADLKATIEQAIDAGGSVADRSGKPGLDQAKVDVFFADIDKLAAWAKAGVQPLGADSAAAADALAAVKAKCEDYFARCSLAAYDSRAAAGVNGQDADFIALGAKALSNDSNDIARLPLARIEAGRALPLRGAVNPAWAAALATFADKAVKPVIGAREALTADDFQKIVDKLGPVLAWRADKPASPVAKLDDARIATLASGPHRGRLAELIAADKALEGEYAAISSVDKMVRLQRDFGRILRNFVNFSDFYSKGDGAFQAGTLYLDGRAFHLSVPVSDAGKHGALAGMSAAYLAYCDLKRSGGTRTVAVALTNGDADNIFVGRNGIFYDRKGQDWDATITKLVSNPISIREAFWSPYKKLIRMIEDQVGKRAAEAEAKSHSKIEGAATAVATVDKPKDAAPAPAKKGLDLGIIALMSVAIGAVLGALAAMVGGIAKLGIWAPLGVLGLLMVISGPSMLLAWLKLRQRNLGPILDANGWAVNTKARVNVALGAAMTDLAVLPPGSTRTMDDPYADKKRPWKLYITLIVIAVLGASWFYGKLDGLLPVESIKSTKVMGCSAPKLQKEFGTKAACKACTGFPTKAACDAAAKAAAEAAAKAAADDAATKKAAEDAAAKAKGEPAAPPAAPPAAQPPVAPTAETPPAATPPAATP